MQAVVPSPAFTAFAGLPLELREQVWRDALPGEPDRPVLFPYVEGSWARGSLSPGHEWYTELENGINVTSQFTTTLAPDIAVKTPLLDVNREARRVAVAWARKRGYTIKRRGGGGGGSGSGSGTATTTTTTTTRTTNYANYEVDIPGPLVIARPVDPSHDAIYLPTHKVANSFVSVPWSLWTRDETSGFHFDSSLTAIALPRAIFIHHNSEHLFFEFDMTHPRLRLLYLILDPQPEDIGVGSWELRDDSTYGPGSFVWDHARRVFVYPKREPNGAGEDMCEAVYGIAEMLGSEEEFRTYCIQKDFEIRLAHAVKLTDP